MGESFEFKGPVNKSGERTVVRDMCFIGISWGGNACMVDVKDDKVVRIRPARFYDRYTREEVKPWVMHARGKTFDPGDKTLPPPFSIAYKKRVYSPARIRFPMKRVDFDPAGAPGSTGPGGRNIQNRGVSKYERISWDEALDIITGEMHRIKETYGATAILYQNDQHGENKTVHGPHGCGRKLLDLFGGYTHQVRNADSWEGWYWGAKHVWGCEPIGQQLPQKNLLYDISKNAELLLFWGCDQETTTWGWGGQLPSRFSYWWTELGIKQIYIAPDCNYANAVHADKWIPILPNTDAALYLAIAHRWFTRGHLRQGVPGDPRVRRGQVRGLRHGRGRRGAQEPGVGGPHHRSPRPRHQSAGGRVGLQAHHHRHRQRRTGHPRPLLHRACPAAGAAASPCRAWASPAATRPR